MNNTKENLEGQMFGSLFVILDINDKNNSYNRLCECLCLCGKLVECIAGRLKNGERVSCGCRFKFNKSENLIGFKTDTNCEVIRFIKINNSNAKKWILKCNTCNNTKDWLKHQIRKDTKCYHCNGLYGVRYGRWTILTISGKRRNNYQCRCKCGKLKIVRLQSLKYGESLSCGCIAKEKHRERSKISGYDKKTKRDLNSTLWKQLVKYIKLRDKNLCYLCDGYDNIEIHHMNGWKSHKEERYEETNLISLCGFCHNDFHAKYGTCYVTRNMFYEHISGFIDKDDFQDTLSSYKKNNGFIFHNRNKFIEE